MKLISWNVNGIRACLQKGFLEFLNKEMPDFLCLQETKLQEGQLDLEADGYYQYWNYAEKKGYSGTAILAKFEPLTVQYGIGREEHDHEGRVITLEYSDFYLVTVYTPNAQRGLARLDYRMQWEAAFLDYLICLEEIKPVIFCGDLNVAHKEIDLKNPNSNKNNAGFSDEERHRMDVIINHGFIDTYRYLYPEQKDAYTWWSYMFNARTNNVGWRIDYFCVSNSLKERIVDATIYSDILGSDHCPVGLELR